MILLLYLSLVIANIRVLMEIKFIGATESVTGSKHLLTSDSKKKILLDCGLYQGLGKETDPLNRSLGVDPYEIDAVLLSHAHIDHSGNLPLLVKEGYGGKIICTPATEEVCKILLMDSANIHENDVYFINKRRERKGLEKIKPLYTIADAEKCLSLFHPIPVNTDVQIFDDVWVRFTEAGHILGSAITNLKLKRKNGEIVKLTYSGDVGRYGDMLMKDPDPFPQADYLILESTYGNSLHDKQVDATNQLLEIVKNTCLIKKGRLIIPAFSLGRTQEIVYTLNKLFNQNKLPKLPIYVDSPLSASATKVMRDHHYCLNEDVQKLMEHDPDPFGFDGLTYIRKAEESKLLNENKSPCIIISSSGMMDAGRIKHHLIHTLPNQKNTILISGYCSPGTLGGKLLDGANEVRVFGDMVPVKAEIKTITSFSAHADYSELLKFISCQDKSLLKNIFLVHGETEVKKGFKTILEKYGYSNILIPFKNESVKL